MSISTNTKLILLFVTVLMVLIGYGLFLIGITWPISVYSISKAGAFGDSFGVVTSLFTGLAFVGLVITLSLQRKDLEISRRELSLTRDEMKQARFDAKDQAVERTFFNMLSMYNNLVENISIRDKKDTKGVDSFEYAVIKINEIINSGYSNLIVMPSDKEEGILISYYH